MFWLRDHTVNSVVKEKSPEDAVAWDVSESASVWATSLAIWALLGTRYVGPRCLEIAHAAMWLIEQQRFDGGWGFDRECESRIYFTGLALKALQQAALFLPLSSEQVSRVHRVRQFGVRFILERCSKAGTVAYWTTKVDGEEQLDPTSTLYAVWVLFEENRKQYDELIKGAVQFLRNTLRGRETWEFRQFVSEASTRYGTQKIIVSFTPSFVIPLLRMNIHPLDDLCLKPITWLRTNIMQAGWILPGYSSHALSFTTAYALWSVTQWHRYLVRHTIEEMVVAQPFVLRALRKRLSLAITVIILLCILTLLMNTQLIPSATSSFEEAIERYGPGVSLIVALMAVIGVPSFVAIVRHIDSNLLSKRVSNLLRKIKTAIERLVYLK